MGFTRIDKSPVDRFKIFFSSPCGVLSKYSSVENFRVVSLCWLGDVIYSYQVKI